MSVLLALVNPLILHFPSITTDDSVVCQATNQSQIRHMSLHNPANERESAYFLAGWLYKKISGNDEVVRFDCIDSLL